jgi:hypothetical protein
MSRLPIAAQKLPADHVLFVQSRIRAGHAVTGNDLLLAIEQRTARPLSEEVRSIVRRAIIPAVKTRGRPRKFGAALDLALETVDRKSRRLD